MKITFDIESVAISPAKKNSKFSNVSLDFFASGDNAHHLYVSEETLMKTADTILGCPIIWKYDAARDDAYTHDRGQVPCGFVPETAEITNRKLADGRVMLTVNAYIWKRYTGNLLEIFERDGLRKSVSVEMIVLSSTNNGNTTELTDFSYEGITILGELATPAITGAEARITSFSSLERDYLEDLKVEFSDYYNKISKLWNVSPETENKKEETMQEEDTKTSEEVLDKEVEATSTDAPVVSGENTDVVEHNHVVTVGETEETPVQEEVKNSETFEKEEEDEDEDKDEETEEDDDEEEMAKDEPKEEKEEEAFSAREMDLLDKVALMSKELAAEMKKTEELVAENSRLKKFKEDVEASQKAFAVEQMMKELEMRVVIPEDKREEMIAEAEKYSLNELDAWKQYCKAISFDFAVVESRNESDVVTVGLPFYKASSQTEQLWSVKNI